MSQMHWMAFFIGWLVGSFFGLQAILAMLRPKSS